MKRGCLPQPLGQPRLVSRGTSEETLGLLLRSLQLVKISSWSPQVNPLANPFSDSYLE